MILARGMRNNNPLNIIKSEPVVLAKKMDSQTTKRLIS